MKIQKVTLYTLRIPIPLEAVNCPEFAGETLQRGATGLLDGPWFGGVPMLVARVEGGGVAGWADLSRGGDVGVVAGLAGRLIGREAGEIEPRADLFGGGKPHRGLHTAALDWAARVKGAPLHAMFGPKVREGVKVAMWSGHRTPAGAAALAKKAWDQGIRCLKLKSSLRADDAGIVAAVKRAVPGMFEVVIDPNGRWETEKATLTRAKGIREANEHAWLEDPIYAQEEMVARVARATGIPMIRTAAGRAAVARVAASTARAFNLVGTWPELLEASQEVEARGLAFWSGSAVDTGLFDLANVHFGVTQPAFTMATELAGSQVREHSLLAKPIRMENGVAIPGDEPGLGIETDLDAVERYRIADPVVLVG